MAVADNAAAGALPRSEAVLLALFSGTLFTAAALVFSVQPMVAKMLLPAFGGSPAVWNTALVFFQAALLAGYAYAHLLARLRNPRHQVEIHLAVLAVAAVCLPIAAVSGSSDVAAVATAPALRLLGLLALTVGLPFVALSATAPLVQHWFARSGHVHAGDPYFLYAASNLGSVLALLGYPLLIEPRLGVTAQSEAWAMLYLGAGALIMTCGILAARRYHRGGLGAAAQSARSQAPVNAAAAAPAWRRRATWIACSAIPSALLLGVTNHITTDLAAAPLLWVGPLVLYLLTFVIAFARRPIVAHRIVVRTFPFAVTILAAIFVCVEPAGLLLPVHLIVFSLAALLCHGELARRRPDPAQLTVFYFHLSLGGVLGGMAAALVAPVVFNAVYEYPLALAAACLILPGRPRAPSRGDVGLAAGLAIAILGGRSLADAVGLHHGGAVSAALIVVGAIVAFGRKERPTAFALAVGAVLLASATGVSKSDTILRARSFFGAYRIAETADAGGVRLLMHGTTLHGAQSIDPARRREPLSYYTADGPVAEMIARIQAREAAPRIGVVGLGAGSLVCYRRPADDWTFYEIDPLVVRLAADARYFSVLEACAGPTSIVVGDARLTLTREPRSSFSLLVIDAFTSDSIPVHLLTAEALALYVDKLAADGVLLLHISNRHFDLEPVLARAIEALDLAGCSGKKSEASADGISSAASHWIAVARSGEVIDRLALSERWRALPAADGQAVWTDAYSNIFSALRW